mmetsp:Transcript_7667/g.18490  ORF Transcript_7667/g.18490 Transcript_7667/m.18490 type:complete len:407 (+) Transcript_7667:58-1278(+)
MSAYALPGLFPPIDSVSQSFSVGNSSTDDTTGDIEDRSFGKNMPLHLKHTDGNHSNLTNGDNKHNAEDNDGLSSSSCKIGCILTSAAVAVKEAKIDPVRWIQYVTGSRSTTQQNSHQHGRTLRRRATTGSSNSHKLGTSPSGQSIGTHGESSTSPNNNSSGFGGGSSNGNESRQNEAIEFELSITVNGRRYTAKRTMQCIMQFRDDLIREMKRRKQWLTQEEGLQHSPPSSQSLHQRTQINQINNHGGHPSLAHSPFLKPTHNSVNNLATNPEQLNNEFFAVQIPEIPPFTGGDDRGTGFVGRGFTMLHAMVKSYVPVMESWFQNVMEIVPQDSECLMNFLWEPTTESSYTCFKSVLDSVNSGDYTSVSNRFKSNTSLATLGSIKELDSDTEDSDSEDRFEEYSAD